MRDRQYASKARPVIINQNDEHNSFNSIILCLFTTCESTNIDTRVLIHPSIDNGLQKDSYVMTDKIVTVHKNMLGERIGRMTEEEMNIISEQIRIILGL